RATGAHAPNAALVTVAVLRCALLGILHRTRVSVEGAALSVLRNTDPERPGLRQAGRSATLCTGATLDGFGDKGTPTFSPHRSKLFWRMGDPGRFAPLGCLSASVTSAPACAGRR